MATIGAGRVGRFVRVGLFATALALTGVTMTPAPASAGILNTIIRIFRPSYPKPGPGTYRPAPAPEIDPNTARAAAAIVLGGVLALADRRRRA